MDFNSSLRRAIKTGEVLLGQHKTEKTIQQGKAQLVVLSGNCPVEYAKRIGEIPGIAVHTFEGTSVALGKACGKPFMVSALAIVNPGESDILSIKRSAQNA